MATMIPTPQKRRRCPGFTIPTFAETFNLPVGMVRRAVKNGEITTVNFGGRNLISPSEARRICELFELRPKDGESHGEYYEDSEQGRKPEL
jgi:hypothetical protein